jgi:hypothetical protein
VKRLGLISRGRSCCVGTVRRSSHEPINGDRAKLVADPGESFRVVRNAGEVLAAAAGQHDDDNSECPDATPP